MKLNKVSDTGLKITEISFRPQKKDRIKAIKKLENNLGYKIPKCLKAETIKGNRIMKVTK